MKLAIVGEAYGESEERLGLPFIGASGQELTKMLREAGINRSECFVTNVFNFRPKDNDIGKLCVNKKLATELYREWRPKLADACPTYLWPDNYDWHALGRVGQYVHPQFLGELARLRIELSKEPYTLVVALGNTAMWGLLNRTGIGKARGFVYPATLLSQLSVLPTFHPAAVLRQWNLRPVAIADFQKAKRLLHNGNPGVGSLHPGAKVVRSIWLEPSLSDITLWIKEHLMGGAPISVDIETTRNPVTITCIGFSDRACSITIPFQDKRKPGWNYWASPGDEALALSLVQRILHSPNPKIFQNCLFDLSILWKLWGVVPRGPIEDTMLIHHSLQPEMSKDLGFLGSVYSESNYAWKGMRKASQQSKRED